MQMRLQYNSQRGGGGFYLIPTQRQRGVAGTAYSDCGYDVRSAVVL